jgi:hypothetical protein
MLIYSNTFEEYQEPVNLVLEAFEKASLYLKLEKYTFYYQEVKYLGLIISTKGIKIDLEKITTVQDWEAPCNLKDIHTFFRFANFYYCFI